MIERDTLEEISDLKRLSIANTEKDYLLEVLLFILSANTRYLVFRGGTALYKYYNLNRFSEDLDFDIVGKGVKVDKLIELITRKLELLGMKRTISEFEEYGNETNIRLLIRGPYTMEERTALAE
ncbi:MAG TPA: hypothetical protein ENK47_06715 [Euryarchaeota archaeon]|nr:hypothetical protein [Euryarchaeota archaeon]